MTPSFLVTGSLAFDRIAVFRGHFSQHILPRHVHTLNVSFGVDEMELHHGGTAGNIAYNLALLGEKPILLAASGYDAGDYLKSLNKAGIDTSYVKRHQNLLTANGVIMTDMDDNQITAFYPGAMKKARELSVTRIKKKLSLAIVAPNDAMAMLQYVEECRAKGIPFIADPGQAIPAFSSAELRAFISGAHTLIVNDYEYELLKEKTKWSEKQLLKKVSFLIVTYAHKGSKIWRDDSFFAEIPAYPVKQLMDPTGCGDAYRAGLMYGHQHELNIESSSHIGAWLAAKCAQKKGTQNHHVTHVDFAKFLKTLG